MRFVGYAKMYCERCQMETSFRVSLSDADVPTVSCEQSTLDKNPQYMFSNGFPAYEGIGSGSVTLYAKDCGYKIVEPTKSAVAVARAREWRATHHAIVRNPDFLPFLE